MHICNAFFFLLSIKDFPHFLHCFVQLMFAKFHYYYNCVCSHWIAKRMEMKKKYSFEPFLVFPVLIRYIWLHSEQCIWKLTTKCGKKVRSDSKNGIFSAFIANEERKMDLNSKITTIVRGRSSDICRNVIGQIVHTTHSITYNIGAPLGVCFSLSIYFIVRISMNDIFVSCCFFSSLLLMLF